MRALLVVIALGFSMAILIAVPAGIAANQSKTQALTGNLGNTINETGASINQSLTEIDCSLASSTPSGFGFSNSGTYTGGGSFGGSGSGPVMQYGGGAFSSGGSTPMNESYYSDIDNISGVAAVVPILQVVEGHNETITFPQGGNTYSSGGGSGSAAPTSFNITVAYYIIEGVPLNASLIDNYPILPTNITQGRNLEPNETGDVVLSENSSAYFNATVGDTIDILGENFTVVGIYSPSGVSDDQYVYMNIADAQALTNNTDTVTSLEVFANSTSEVSSVASAISALHSELSVTTVQQQESELQQIESSYESELADANATMNQTNTQAFEEIIIAVAATSIIVLFVMLYTVRERTEEIGTLKAIGFSSRSIMSQFMLEGITLSVIAGVVGIVIGVVAAPMLSSLLLPSINLFGSSGGTHITAISTSGASSVSKAAVSVSPELMLIAFGAAVALGAVGSLYPAWRASRTRPAEAMRYE